MGAAFGIWLIAIVSGRSEDQQLAVPGGAALPNWPAPAVKLAPGSPSLASGQLQLIHSRDALGGFVVQVAGRQMAIGQCRPFLGYLQDGKMRWTDLAEAPTSAFVLESKRDSVRAKLSFSDGDGAHWNIEQEFQPALIPDAIAVKTEITVDRDRAVVFLPLLTLFPGVGDFGAQKGQALFAGLEYLDNEPSSSEADVIGPASKRQVPDNLKITFPLMAIEDEVRYVALTWEMQPDVSALFDSPDRLFNSGGHVMGLLFPGSYGKNREEGNLLPRTAQLLAASQPLVLQATILGGLGDSVVPAIKQYVALRGLPPLPALAGGIPKYAALAAAGWLDSGIREGDLFRHAIGGNFKPGPAADAAVWMEWLACNGQPPDQVGRLQASVSNVLSKVSSSELNFTGVGHIRYPLASLLYGHVAESIARARDRGHDLLRSFDPDGSLRYRPKPGWPDLGKTHFTNEANGLTAAAVQELLETASFSGQPELIEAALKELRAMNHFRYGVPRGAQTWEVPLHTPDILASAHLVRAYTLGYQLTGEANLLELARYWAWTGVPFVYLVNPAARPVGPYATIAVYGATQWRAPVWMGLPVQWCGLVYADALYRLAPHDRAGPWKALADGITLSGIQQTWPQTDPKHQGLLPDSFVLRSEQRNEPAINPATLEACAACYFGQKPVCDFCCFHKAGLRVHAPGQITNPKETKISVSFRIEPWVKHPFYVLINGLTTRPKLGLDGKPTVLADGSEFLETEGCLILKLQGEHRVQIARGK